MAGEVRRTLEDTPGALGLAVIITNDYSTIPREKRKELEELPGTIKDGEALSEAFKDLKFAVCWKTNVDNGTLAAMIRDLKTLEHCLVKKFRCIIFVFAGHGDSDDVIYMQDCTKVYLEKDVVTPLLPENSDQIGNVPKAFLIDACRGKEDTQTAVVPRKSRSGHVPEETGERGGSEVSFEIPKGSNVLLAYSTLSKHKSYESVNVGGVWLSTVARLLKEKQYLFCFEHLLTRANEAIMEEKNGNSKGKHFQQPIKSSTLNKIICLDPNSKC